MSSHAILAIHTGNGDIVITSSEDSITTKGRGSIGIVALHTGTSNDKSITINFDGQIHTTGELSEGIRIGRLLSGGVVDGGGVFDVSGYRMQRINLNGHINSAGTGVYLAGGGRVFIGPKGIINSGSRKVILATGDTSGDNPGESIPPKLYLDINLDGRNIADVIGDDGWILNDNGGTTIVINGVKLHDSSTGVIPDAYAANGITYIKIRPDGVRVDHTQDQLVISERQLGVVADRDFSVDDFILLIIPGGALYDLLPNYLLNLNKPILSFSEIRKDSTSSPFWINLSTNHQTFYPRVSTTGTKYRSQINGFELGTNFLLGDRLVGTTFIRAVEGSAKFLTNTEMGGGKIQTNGYVLGLEIDYEGVDGWYARSTFLAADYNLDFHSTSQGLVAKGIESRGVSLDLEVGKTIKLDRGIELQPRVGIRQIAVFVEDFTDQIGSSVKMPKNIHRAISPWSGYQNSKNFHPNGPRPGLASFDRL